MPQRQYYPTSNQRHQQALLLTSANRDSALRVGQNNLSPPVNSDAPNNPTNRSAPRQLGTSYQLAPRQPYQSNPSYRGYQRRNKKGAYQVDDEEFDPHPVSFYTALEQEAEEIQYLDEGFDEVNANFVGIETSCGKCGTPFSSKSRLHKYLKDGCTSSVHPLLPDAPASTSPIPIIISKSMASAMGSGLALQGWTYATAAVTLVPQVLPLESDPGATAYFDTGCGVTLVDKHWLLRQLPDQKIKEMSTPLKVREIGASKHESAQFAELSLFLPGENNKGQKVYTSFKCELHLVEGLRANMLIGNNILAPENFVLNIGLGHAVVRSCGVKITMKAKQRGQFLKRKLLAENDGVVSPHFEAMIPILSVSLPDDRDFLFHPATQTNLTLYTHIVDHETTKVLVRNTSDRPLRISRQQKLGHIVDIHYDNCFLVDAKSAF